MTSVKYNMLDTFGMCDVINRAKYNKVTQVINVYILQVKFMASNYPYGIFTLLLKQYIKTSDIHQAKRKR